MKQVRYNYRLPAYLLRRVRYHAVTYAAVNFMRRRVEIDQRSAVDLATELAIEDGYITDAVLEACMMDLRSGFDCWEYGGANNREWVVIEQIVGGLN